MLVHSAVEYFISSCAQGAVTFSSLKTSILHVREIVALQFRLRRKNFRTDAFCRALAGSFVPQIAAFRAQLGNPRDHKLSRKF